jgi:hypothetical protein
MFLFRAPLDVVVSNMKGAWGKKEVSVSHAITYTIYMLILIVTTTTMLGTVLVKHCCKLPSVHCVSALAASCYDQ